MEKIIRFVLKDVYAQGHLCGCAYNLRNLNLALVAVNGSRNNVLST